jgi:hypothetical protein
LRVQRTFPNISNMDDQNAFTKLVEALVAEHITVIPILGKGMSELRGTHKVDMGFMDRLLMTRISRRVLAEQHIALHNAMAASAQKPGYIGVINLDCKLQDIVRRCYDKAAGICDRTYGHFPPLQFEGDPDASLAYIPVHLEYMCDSKRNCSRRFLGATLSAQFCADLERAVFDTTFYFVGVECNGLQDPGTDEKCNALHGRAC